MTHEATVARTGRKREARPRHPGGQVKREGKVGPTPEQEARKRLLGPQDDLLGMMLHNDAINDHQCRAGRRYRQLYESVFGRWTSPIGGYGQQRGSSTLDLDDPETIKRLENGQRELLTALRRLEELRVRRDVDPVCLGNRPPKFMRPFNFPTIHDVDEAGKLIRGLKALTKVLNDVG